MEVSLTHVHAHLIHSNVHNMVLSLRIDLKSRPILKDKLGLSTFGKHVQVNLAV